MEANFEAYLSSWSSEFLAKSNQVRELIGSAHWLSDGHHKESLIRSFLSTHLPSGLDIKRGFIRPPSLDASPSPEIDVLISDSTRHPPLFSEGELHILAPSSVVGHIEVKTTLSATTLKDALENVSRVQTAIATYADPSPVARGILFATHGSVNSLSSFADMFERTILKRKADSGFVVDQLPNWCATYDKFSVFLVPDQPSGKIRLKAFESGKLSAALVYADLFSTIRLNEGHSSAFEMDEIVESINLPPPHQKLI